MEIYDYIMNNYKNDLNLGKIAEKLNIHPTYVSKLFHSQSGIHLQEFINMMRLYEAQRLLISTDKKIIDIALESGFGSASNFYDNFSRYVSLKPSQYRSSMGITREEYFG